MSTIEACHVFCRTWLGLGLLKRSRLENLRGERAVRRVPSGPRLAHDGGLVTLVFSDAPSSEFRVLLSVLTP